MQVVCSISAANKQIMLHTLLKHKDLAWMTACYSDEVTN